MKKIMITLLIGIVLSEISGCNNNTKGTTHTSQTTSKPRVTQPIDHSYTTIGKEIIQTAFRTLSRSLKEQIMAGGPASAVPFCKTHASILTDSLAKVYEVTIQRVAVKYRNPNNKASSQDMEVFNAYLSDMDQGKILSPKLTEDTHGRPVFYAPILLKPQCVICHGQPREQIGEETMMTIKSLYPNDSATGFNEGNLRGLWKITFKQ